MFAILSQYLELVLKLMIEKGFDYGRNKLEIRRSLLSKLLELYNAVQALGNAVETALSEFDSYARKEDVATKVVSARILAQVADSFERLYGAEQEVTKVLEIYDRPLHVLIKGASTGKGPLLLDIINISNELSPSMAQIDGAKTFTLKYPTIFPSIKDNDTGLFRRPTDEVVAQLRDATKNTVRTSMEFHEVDIRDASALQELVEASRINLKNIRQAEISLREFIQKNYSLEQVFDAAR